jgi:branched-subunit amino acid aminotransferase/4-amino-4-deoxychorismate lyase
MKYEIDAYGFPKTHGIFETIKTVDGKALELTRHMRRALESAHALGIRMPAEDALRGEIENVCRQHPYSIGRLRICIFRDGFLITHDDYVEPTSALRLTIHSQTVIGLSHKKFPYDDRFAILDVAKNEGYDDAILLNSKNEITESAVSNLVFRIADEWVTPPITSGALPGIMRGLAIEKCGVRVRAIHISEIPEIEAALSLASLRITQPISHIGEMKLQIGEQSRQLESAIRGVIQAHSVG